VDSESLNFRSVEMGAEVIANMLSLSPDKQVLIATAVLLDGREAARYLVTDVEAGNELASIAEILGKLDPELRTAFAATVLRVALQLRLRPRGSDDR
jgi:hypothetical protein